MFTTVFRIWLPDSNRYVNIRTVLQVRVKPEQFEIGPQTIGKIRPIDPPIPNDAIEWSLTARNCVIPTAVLIQLQESEGNHRSSQTSNRSLLEI